MVSRREPQGKRVLRARRIVAQAEDVLGSREKASRWLRTPNRALGQTVPLRHLDTARGVRLVKGLLVRIAHGVVS
jgi:putative toxin-antitoxin system antitoxin component (TIGR02293 family)